MQRHLLFLFLGISSALLCDIPDVTVQTTGLLPWAEDWGDHVHLLPGCVAFPKDADEVAEVLHYANQQGLRVVIRGTGHTTGGQSQVDGGIVVDTRNLNRLDVYPGKHYAVIGAGLTWTDVIASLAGNGQRLVHHPDTSPLSVGGILSMGGVAATSMTKGAVADYVMSMQVVTGSGKVVFCSPTKNRWLFQAVLGGIGQYGVIVWAQVPIVPLAPFNAADQERIDNMPVFPPIAWNGDEEVLLSTFFFDNALAYVQALDIATTFESIDGLDTVILQNRDPVGPASAFFGFDLDLALTVSGFNRSASCIYAFVVVDLAPATVSPLALAAATGGIYLGSTALSYPAWAMRHEVLEESLESVDFYSLPKDTYTLLLPLKDLAFQAWYAEIMESLCASQLPFVSAAEIWHIPSFGSKTFVQVPREWEYTVRLYLIPMSAIPPGLIETSPWMQWAQADVALRGILQDALSRWPQAKTYPVGVFPYTSAQHYGNMWTQAKESKAHFDPNNVLGGSFDLFEGVNLHDYMSDSSSSSSSD